MCLFQSANNTPAVDPNDQIEADNKAAAEQQKKEDAKAKQLEKQVARRKVGGGAGRKSLLTGNKAALGYYDETL